MRELPALIITLTRQNACENFGIGTEVASTSMLCWFSVGNKQSILINLFFSLIWKKVDSNHSFWASVVSRLGLSRHTQFEECQSKTTLTIIEIAQRFSSCVHWEVEYPMSSFSNLKRKRICWSLGANEIRTEGSLVFKFFFFTRRSCEPFTSEIHRKKLFWQATRFRLFSQFVLMDRELRIFEKEIQQRKSGIAWQEARRTEVALSSNSFVIKSKQSISTDSINNTDFISLWNMTFSRQTSSSTWVNIRLPPLLRISPAFSIREKIPRQ